MGLEDIFVENLKWPPPGSAQRLLDIERYNRLFGNDRTTLLEWAMFQLQVGGTDDDDRFVRRLPAMDDFVPFPAPEIAARTLSSFLFGEEAHITSETAQDSITVLARDNHLHALNQEAAVSAAVEGEIYYKLDWDEDISDLALISAVSSAYVFPSFRFRRLQEICFVSELDTSQITRIKGKTHYRHVEIRKRGEIINRLFAGGKESFGLEIDLEDHPDTEGLDERVETGFDDVLVRHVPFWRTTRSPHGISVFANKDGLIEAIHRLYSQDQHDAEMTKRRVAAPSSYLARDQRGNPKFNRDLDVFELSDEAAGPIGSGNAPIQQIEFTDSTVMGQRIAQRIDEFLLACGIAPQSAGRDVTGSGESGTARKLAQSLTLQTVATAARYFRPALEDVVSLALQIGKKHLGQTNVPDDFTIAVEMQDGLVDDDVETANIVSTLAGAAALSTREKVRRLHPNWDDDKIDEEVERIHEDEGLKVPAPLDGLGSDEDNNEGGE